MFFSGSEITTEVTSPDCVSLTMYHTITPCCVHTLHRLSLTLLLPNTVHVTCLLSLSSARVCTVFV